MGLSVTVKGASLNQDPWPHLTSKMVPSGTYFTSKMSPPLRLNYVDAYILLEDGLSSCIWFPNFNYVLFLEGKHPIKRQLYSRPFILREAAFLSSDIDDKDLIHRFLACFFHITAPNADSLTLALWKCKHTS